MHIPISHSFHEYSPTCIWLLLTSVLYLDLSIHPSLLILFIPTISVRKYWRYFPFLSTIISVNDIVKPLLCISVLYISSEVWTLTTLWRLPIFLPRLLTHKNDTGIEPHYLYFLYTTFKMCTQERTETRKFHHMKLLVNTKKAK